MKKKLTAITAFSSVARREFVLLFLFIMIASFTIGQQKVIQLYNGVAPGSENWNWEEKETTNPMNYKIVYNVVKPSLLVFSPDSPNGTAVILCSGGGNQVINIEHEGIDVANELNKKRITVFVLKYRVIRSSTDDPWQEVLNNLKEVFTILKDTATNNLKDTSAYRKKTAEVRELAFDDLKTAMNYVRKNATAHRVDPNKIGVVGFSGGANMATRLSMYDKPETRPDFIGLIYGGGPFIRSVKAENIPTTTPRAFIACAADDSMAASNSMKMYAAWNAAKIPAELHIYSKGGHGLRFAPGSTWTHRFEEWLKNEGF